MYEVLNETKGVSYILLSRHLHFVKSASLIEALITELSSFRPDIKI